ncbi:MAG TPA: thioredoxin family protein [Sulfurimonas autotrophica]|nr:thioredoxin family protein [Sulfurimonas autotrophica]
MLKMISILLVCTGSLFALDWVKDIETALTLAKKEKKNVMVMVESEHCRWCQKMKHRTLSDENVEKRLKKFVIVKVMREDENAMKHLPEVKGVPTVFFMTEKKKVIEEVIGYFDVLDFTSYIGDVEKKVAQ